MAPPRRTPTEAVVSGYLRKLGRRRWTWKRRFFVLSRTHASLTYWQDEAAFTAGALPLGSIFVAAEKASVEEGPLTELLPRSSAGPTSDAERTLNTALRRMTYALNQRSGDAAEGGAGAGFEDGGAEDASLARWLEADGASATFEERLEALGCGVNRTLFLRVTGGRLKRRSGADANAMRSAARRWPPSRRALCSPPLPLPPTPRPRRSPRVGVRQQLRVPRVAKRAPKLHAPVERGAGGVAHE